MDIASTNDISRIRRSPSPGKYSTFPTQEIRQKLNLNSAPMNRIPDDFIRLLFTSETDLPTNFQMEMESKYNTRDYEAFEFVGDTVLSYIIVNIMIEMGLINSPGNATRIKQEITRNSSLACLMQYLDLCQYRIRGGYHYESSGTEAKHCADVFESIIGGVFWYLEHQLLISNTSQILQTWLLKTWPIKECILNILQHGRFKCPSNIQHYQVSLSRSPQRKNQPIDIIYISDSDEDIIDVIDSDEDIIDFNDNDANIDDDDFENESQWLDFLEKRDLKGLSMS